MTGFSNRPDPRQPSQPPEPEPPPSPQGWRIAVIVWLLAFAFLIAYELLGSLWRLVRSLFS